VQPASSLCGCDSVGEQDVEYNIVAQGAWSDRGKEIVREQWHLVQCRLIKGGWDGWVMGLSWGSLYQNFVTQHQKKINGKSGWNNKFQDPVHLRGFVIFEMSNFRQCYILISISSWSDFILGHARRLGLSQNL
jgi:hypothetical protein